MGIETTINLRLWIIIFFSILVLSLIIVSFFANRQNKLGSDNVLEYYLGGRVTPPIILAFSYVTSSVSAAAFMGEPGVMSEIGWPYYWVVIFIVPALILPVIFLLTKLRNQSESLGSLTIPEYLGHRYKSVILQVIVAIVISFFYLFVLVAQFKGASVLLESFTGIPFNTGLLIFTLVVSFFVAFGGLRSVVWTDFIQGLPMFICAIVLTFVSLKAVGGLSGIEEKLSVSNPDMLRVVEPRGPDAVFPIEGVIGSIAYWIVIFLSQPYLSSRFLAMPDTRRKTIGTFLLWSLLLGVVFNAIYLVGLAGRILYPDLPGDYMSSQLAIDLLSTPFAALMMVGIFAAMMTTTSSIMLVVGQAIGRDIYYHTINKNASPKKVIQVTRIAIVVIAFATFLLTFSNPPDLLSIILYLGLSGIGACIGVPLFAAILWKKAKKEGAITAAIVGPIIYVVLTYGLNVNFWFSSFIGVIISAILMIVISIYIDRKRDYTDPITH